VIITKRFLPRRTVLRGIGCTLALPFLDAMVPALSASAKTAANPVRRLGVVYVPNGMAMEYWTPAGEGAGFEFTPILQSLAPFRNQLLVLSGLKSSWDQTHPGATTAFLTAAAGRRGEVAVKASTSMDQLVARHFSQETQLASLELSLDSRSNAGQCTAGYSCVYTNTLSWRTPTTPLTPESNPRTVFERLFGDSAGTDAASRRARGQQDRSILDQVARKVVRLKRDVGPRDAAKIDEYLEGVHDVERRLRKFDEQGVELPAMKPPEGIPATFEEHSKVMYDLQLLAYQADLTRVITFMVGREESGRTYNEIGVPEAHHPLSHHMNDPERILRMSKINTLHVRLFADYAKKLQSTPDGDGSLLDHVMILYGSGLSDSNRHLNANLPLLLVGGGSGRLKGGRHLKYPDGTPTANLLVTMMDKLGVPEENLGNSTGKLDIDLLSGV